MSQSEMREVPLNQEGAAICPFCRNRNVEGAPNCKHYQGVDRARGVALFHPMGDR